MIPGCCYLTAAKCRVASSLNGLSFPQVSTRFNMQRFLVQAPVFMLDQFVLMSGTTNENTCSQK